MIYDLKYLRDRHHLKKCQLICKTSFSPYTNIIFSDGYELNIKHTSTLTIELSTIDGTTEYFNIIKDEIIKYCQILRHKKLERICNGVICI